MVATARPLPPGTTAAIKTDHNGPWTLYVTRNGVTVPAYVFDQDDESGSNTVELSEDGRFLVATVRHCDDTPDVARVSLAAIDARFENLRGMQAHVKKQYAAAIPHFETAAALDPDSPVYATNLLAAQALADDAEGVERTLATYSALNVPWFAWRLAVDPELATVSGDRRAAVLTADHPGHARVSDLSFVAYSPFAGGMVATLATGGAGGMPSGQPDTWLVITELATSRELLRILVTDENPKQNAQRRAVADRLLAQLGFELAGKSGWKVDEANDVKHASSPDHKIQVDVDRYEDADPKTSVWLDRGYDLKVTVGRASSSYHRSGGSPRYLEIASVHGYLVLRDSHQRCADFVPARKLETVALPGTPAAAKLDCKRLQAIALGRAHEMPRPLVNGAACVLGQFGEPGALVWVNGSEGPRFEVVNGDGSPLAPPFVSTDANSNQEDLSSYPPAFRAVDLDGDGIDEVVVTWQTGAHSDGSWFDVLHLHGGKLVELAGPRISHDTSGYEHHPSSTCKGTLAFEGTGAKARLVVTMTSVRDDEHAGCLAVGRHAFALVGDKLVETK